MAWDSVVEDLTNLGKLHKTDAKLIELYSRSASLFARVESQLANEPLTSGGGRERVFINPLANLYPTLLAKQRQILADLGLTPKTRKTEGEVDEFDRYMRGNAP